MEITKVEIAIKNFENQRNLLNQIYFPIEVWVSSGEPFVKPAGSFKIQIFLIFLKVFFKTSSNSSE
jgi:hypothetical protein